MSRPIQPGDRAIITVEGKDYPLPISKIEGATVFSGDWRIENQNGVWKVIGYPTAHTVRFQRATAVPATATGIPAAVPAVVTGFPVVAGTETMDWFLNNGLTLNEDLVAKAMREGDPRLFNWLLERNLVNQGTVNLFKQPLYDEKITLLRQKGFQI